MESEHEVQQLYRDIQNEITVLKTRLSKGGDVAVAQDVYKRAEALFPKVSSLKNNRLFAQDARVVADLSELTQICIRNLDFDDEFSLVSLDDVVQYSKAYMLRDYLQLSGVEVKTEKTFDLSADSDGTGDGTVDGSNDAGGETSDAAPQRPEHISEMLQINKKRKVLRQYDQYTHFTQFNWYRMGTLFNKVSKLPPTTDHLLGPFGFERKKRVLKERAARDGLAEKSTAENLSKETLTSGQEITTPEQVQRCFKILKRKNGMNSINLFQFVLDPNSYSKSVENLFYTSFLLKENKLQMTEGNDGMPEIAIYKHSKDRTNDNNDGQRGRGDHQNHIIFQLDMPTWQKLVAKLGIKEPFLDY
ncbi:Binding domain of Nse4/EID3 to Nse3-MAGE [Nakaseomyces glabratus]